MKKLVLHKYFTINLFIYINLICICNFIIMLFMLIINPNSVFRLSNPVFTMGIVNFIIIPFSILLIGLEYILRKFNIIKKTCNEKFSFLQVNLIYSIATALLILYLAILINETIYTLHSSIL